MLLRVSLKRVVDLHGPATIEQRRCRAIDQPFSRPQGKADTGAPHWVDGQCRISNESQAGVPGPARDIRDLEHPARLGDLLDTVELGSIGQTFVQPPKARFEVALEVWQATLMDINRKS